MGFTWYLLYGVLVLKGLILNCFFMCGTLELESVDLMAPIQGRLRTFMATVNDPDTHELLEDIIALNCWKTLLPGVSVVNTSCNAINTIVCVQGPLWQSVTVSIPPDRDITDSEVYLFVVVLFFVDKNLRDGEPRVWRELNAAWDAQFGLPPGGGPTTLNGRPALWFPSTRGIFL